MHGLCLVRHRSHGGRVRLRLWRRRLTISAPRMAIRSALPWPVRWLVGGLVLGLSAALALWAFEFGREIAGLDRHSRAELQQLRADNDQLRAALAQAQSVVNTAENLLTTERTAQDRLVAQLRDLEDANRNLRRELGFFEQLMPASGAATASIRGLRARRTESTRVSWQLLLVQPARHAQEFKAELEVTLAGTLDGKPWSIKDAAAKRAVGVKQYLRMVGESAVPASAVVQSVTFRLMQGAHVALTQTVKVGATP